MFALCTDKISTSNGDDAGNLELMLHNHLKSMIFTWITDSALNSVQKWENSFKNGRLSSESKRFSEFVKSIFPSFALSRSVWLQIDGMPPDDDETLRRPGLACELCGTNAQNPKVKLYNFVESGIAVWITYVGSILADKWQSSLKMMDSALKSLISSFASNRSVRLQLGGILPDDDKILFRPALSRGFHGTGAGNLELNLYNHLQNMNISRIADSAWILAQKWKNSPKSDGFSSENSQFFHLLEQLFPSFASNRSVRHLLGGILPDGDEILL